MFYYFENGLISFAYCLNYYAQGLQLIVKGLIDLVNALVYFCKKSNCI